jgi:predicted transcriptional regulator
MPSYSVRISEASHRALREFAREEGKPMQAVLEEALEAHRRRLFWRQANAAFRRLKENREDWKEEQKERALWDHALLDGIEEA